MGVPPPFVWVLRALRMVLRWLGNQEELRPETTEGRLDRPLVAVPRLLLNSRAFFRQNRVSIPQVGMK